MELYQLRTFVAVAEEGNLTRAADRLHASQPAVSGHVKALEQDLDVTLFIRTSRGMELTTAGERLKEKAASILESVSEMESSAQSMRDELEGELRIGLNTDPEFLHISELVAELYSHYPALRPLLCQSASGAILDDVRRKSLDAGFVFYKNIYEEVETMLLGTAEICVVAPVSFADDVCGAGLDVLVDFPWVWPGRRCHYRKALVQEFEKLGRMPSEFIEADGEPIIRQLVASGKGLSLMRRDEAEIEVEAGNLVICEMDLTLKAELLFVYPKGRRNDPALKALQEAVKSVWNV